MTLYNFIKPILFKLEPELAHYFSLYSLKFIHLLGLTKFLFKKQNSKPVSLMGLDFSNRIGLAAGMDKNAEFIEELGSMGFGFIEVGTVTPRPQKGNTKPRLFRLVKQRSIINRMGFNNKGIDFLVKKVAGSFYPGVIGVNIGKNFDTKNEKAVDDYLECFKKAYLVADYIVVNVSSPNTKDLRKLQSEKELRKILEALVKEKEELISQCGRSVPFLIKISPDLDTTSIKEVIELVNNLSIDGIVATNTTISRKEIPEYQETKGGLSGSLLTRRSLETIREVKSQLREEKVLIGVGGVSSQEDAVAMLEAGADLIQIYSSLIYSGPKIVTELIASS